MVWTSNGTPSRVGVVSIHFSGYPPVPEPEDEGGGVVPLELPQDVTRAEPSPATSTSGSLAGWPPLRRMLATAAEAEWRPPWRVQPWSVTGPVSGPVAPATCLGAVV